MSTCPDCRYCAPEATGVPRQGWPHPSRWFDQPCPQCDHRLKAHDPGVPRALATLSVARALDGAEDPGS